MALTPWTSDITQTTARYNWGPPPVIAWTPADIETALWLDASAADTLSLVGSNVSEWRDKSGNERHFANATDSTRPLRVTNGVHFDGEDGSSTNAAMVQILSHNITPWSTTAPLGTYPFCIFMVVDEVGHTGSNSGAVLARYNAMTSYAIALVSATSVSTIHRNTNYRSVSQDVDFSANARHVSSHLFRDSDYRSTRVNGGDETINTAASGALAASSAAVLYLGQERPPSSTYPALSLRATVREIIVLNINPSDTLRNRIFGYLAWKWGIEANLPGDHPYKNSAP
jgi:hypothetical protein